MPNKIPIAIVGLGNMGAKHLERLQNSADFSVTAIIDDRIEQGFVNGIVHLCDYRDFKPGMADAVIIAVPSSLHCEVGLYFLGLGVDIFMEKPLALSYEDCKLLANACDNGESGGRVGRVGMVGMVERFNPAFVACYGLLRGFDIKSGQFRRFKAERFNPSSAISDTDVVMDLMVHDLDILLFLLGDIELEFIEVLDCCVGDYGYDIISVRLVFSGGIECELSAGRGEGCPRARRYIVGEWGDGKFGIDFLTRELDYFYQGGEEYIGELGGDGLVGEHGEFGRRIRDRRDGLKDNLRMMEILFRIKDALNT